MSDIDALQLVRYDSHASANDFTADGASPTFIEPLAPIDLSGLKVNKIDVNTLRGDNQRNARVNGGKPADGFSFSLRARGPSGTDGTKPAAGDFEYSELLTAVFGAAASYSADASSAATVAAVTEGTPSIEVSADGSDFPAGSAILANVGASSEFIAREVVSVATQTLTVDRGGWSGSTTGNTAYGAASYYVDPTAHSTTHLYFDVEGESYRRKMHGALPAQFVINVNQGQNVTFDFNNFQLSDWSDVAEANPSFSAPSVGSDIIAIDSPFYMGDDGTTYANDTAWFVDELKITVDLSLVPRTTPHGTNGRAGFVVANRVVTWEGVLWAGALTLDATDALLDLINTSGKTMDVAVQVGRTAGGTMYCRSPNLDLMAERTIKDGVSVIRFSGVAARSDNHANVPGAFRMHLM